MVAIDERSERADDGRDRRPETVDAAVEDRMLDDSEQRQGDAEDDDTVGDGGNTGHREHPHKANEQNREGYKQHQTDERTCGVDRQRMKHVESGRIRDAKRDEGLIGCGAQPAHQSGRERNQLQEGHAANRGKGVAQPSRG
jgi:hypothetical protein